jgi:hypothetical protein
MPVFEKNVFELLYSTIKIYVSLSFYDIHCRYDSILRKYFYKKILNKFNIDLYLDPILGPAV